MASLYFVLLCLGIHQRTQDFVVVIKLCYLIGSYIGNKIGNMVLYEKEIFSNANGPRFDFSDIFQATPVLVKVFLFKQVHFLVFRGHAKGVNSCCFMDNDNMIVSGSDDHTVKLWVSTICFQFMAS